MKKKLYEAKRRQLLDEAQQLISDGKSDEAKKKMDEVRVLDAEWDAYAQAQADLKALAQEPVFKGPIVTDGAMGKADGDGTGDDDTNDKEKAWASKAYETAWAKYLTERKLSSVEKEKFDMVNEAYTHTTENTSIMIPKSVSKKIWELAGEMYPYFADVSKTYVNGLLSMIQEDSSSDAGWYEEKDKTEDGKETFKEFSLTGCELARSITVSWKLREMAIEEFIPYIERKIAKKMGAAAGYGATHGKGKKEGSKPEPKGVVTALMEEANTPQIVTYAKGKVPAYTAVTEARSKVKSGYGAGLSVYANSFTIWNVIANILDANKRPIFTVDPREGKSFRILGMEVKEDDSMLDGEILLSNAYAGYHNNTNKEVTMMKEDHVKERETDYCGYAIMDGNVTTTKAHALLMYAAETPAEA